MNKKISLREFKNARERRIYLEKQLKIKLNNIGNFSFTEEQVTGRNIENIIGATQIPLGVAGPLAIINHKSLIINHYVPLATTEGALVASVSRGCKAITKSGGVQVFIEESGITRGPVFKVKNISEGMSVKKWINDHFTDLAKTTEATSNHLKLIKIDLRTVGCNLFARFYFNTQDAMGMNMATIATQEAVNLIEKKTNARCVSIAGNFDIDKKPAWLNFISGRGKQAWAEVVINKKAVKEVLKTTPEKIVDIVYRKCLLGSIMSGSLGFNAHFANTIAAVFAATGQDLAHVVEGSLGITTAESLKNGDLYFSIYLPALIVGTVGGGTHLPTQKEAISLMGLKEPFAVLEYAQVLAAAVLAGELSLLASEAEGTLAKAHEKLGRKGK